MFFFYIIFNYIKLNKNYKQQIKKFPTNLKTIKCFSNYTYSDDFVCYNIIKY
jgi:hypothetical protein